MITQQVRKICKIAFAITALAFAAGCTSQPATVAAPTTKTGERAAQVALQQVGVPYRYGGADQSGFDCSGLVHYAYRSVGKPVSRTTRSLWSSTRAVDRKDLAVGDVLFFEIEGKMSHVGLYVGNGQFVHAPSSGRTVTVASMRAPFYRNALLRVGRP